MPEIKFHFNTPTPETLDRFTEIRFQIFMENYLGNKSPIAHQVLEYLCFLSTVNHEEIRSIYDRLLLGILPRQEKYEKAIYISYMSYLKLIPQRHGLKAIGMNPVTLSNIKREYLNNGQPGLSPMLDDEDRNIIKRFLDNIEQYFELTSFVARGV